MWRHPPRPVTSRTAKRNTAGESTRPLSSTAGGLPWGSIQSRLTEAVPADVVHLGGGGFTMPRYLAATRPGTRSTVLEIDPGVVALGREHLGVRDRELVPEHSVHEPAPPSARASPGVGSAPESPLCRIAGRRAPL